MAPTHDAVFIFIVFFVVIGVIDVVSIVVVDVSIHVSGEMMRLVAGSNPFQYNRRRWGRGSGRREIRR